LGNGEVKKPRGEKVTKRKGKKKGDWVNSSLKKKKTHKRGKIKKQKRLGWDPERNSLL